MDLSADGAVVVMARQDGSAESGALATRTSLGILRGHEGIVRSAELGGAGGTTVVTTGDDRTARIWDQNSIEREFVATEDALTADVSADGDAIATGDGSGRVRVFERETGEQTVFLRSSRDVLRDVSFSADGRSLVAVGEDGVARVWDLATKVLVGELRHDDAVPERDLGPDGERVLTGSEDGTARIWEPESGEEEVLWRSDYVNGTAWSPASGLVAFAEQSGEKYSVRVVDPASGAEVAALEHPDAALSVSFDSTGERLVTGGVGGFARIWSVRTGEALVALAGQQAQVESVQFWPVIAPSSPHPCLAREFTAPPAATSSQCCRTV